MSAPRHRRSLAVVVGIAAASGIVPATAAGRSLPTPAPSAAAAHLAAPLRTGARPLESQSSAFVRVCGTQLCLGGAPWTFTGVNAYEAATDWAVNAGCGPELSDSALQSLFSSLKPDDVVRFWAFQALATNYTTKRLDWTGIDRVINMAARYGIKVIPALSNETGGCDDNHWKDAAWYDGGYRNVYDDPGEWPASTPLPFWTYMTNFLQRYRDNPTIAMIELVSEPSPTEAGYRCVDETAAAQALRSFYDTAGEYAKRIDPNHLFESGTQGVGQCGAQDLGCTTSSWTSCPTHDFETAMASPGVDVVSYHDYSAATTAYPSSLAVTEAEAQQIGKPLVVGEMGIEAQDSVPGCISDAARSQDMLLKMRADVAGGASGTLAWDWMPTAPLPSKGCSYDIAPTDPLLAALPA